MGLKTWAVLKSISRLIKRHFPHWHITHRAAHTYLYPHRIFIINRSDSRHLQSAERIFLISPIYCTCWPGKKFTNKNRVCYGIFSCDGICPAFVYICIIRIWHRDQTFRANLWQARFFIARLLRLFLGQCTNLLVPTVHICAELTYITFNSGLCMISIYIQSWTKCILYQVLANLHIVLYCSALHSPTPRLLICSIHIPGLFCL